MEYAWTKVCPQSCQVEDEDIKAVPCDECEGEGAHLQLTKCGHTFHSRCIKQFPISACFKCGEESNRVLCLQQSVVPKSKPTTRDWSCEEKEYVKQFVELFRYGRLPLMKGLSLRLALSKLLHRPIHDITDEFGQDSPINTQRYRLGYSKIAKDVQTSQKQFLKVEQKFYATLKMKEDFIKVKGSAQQFWESEFRRFARHLGQTLVDDLDRRSKSRKKDISPSNKRKRSLSNVSVGSLTIVPPVTRDILENIIAPTQPKKFKLSANMLLPLDSHPDG